MDVKTLNNTPPWEWPEEAGTTILGVLTDEHAEDSDRVLAAELAGDGVVVNDELANALLAIVGNPGDPEELRGTAAISLGPALEHADTFGFEDPDDLLISEAAFVRIQQALRDPFQEEAVPQDVRRRILEASVRAPQEWHIEAVRSAYSSEDGEWKLTAVFCMRFIRGFDEQILEALNSEDPEIHYEAVCAAGSWGVNAALSHVVELAFDSNSDKALRIAAIDAIAGTGGVGGIYMATLARIGVGKFVISDPDSFMRQILDEPPIPGIREPQDGTSTPEQGASLSPRPDLLDHSRWQRWWTVGSPSARRDRSG